MLARKVGKRTLTAEVTIGEGDDNQRFCFLSQRKIIRYFDLKKADFFRLFLFLHNYDNPSSFFLPIVSCETKNEVYSVKGTIRSIDKEDRKALIAHDTIPDLMMPMVMPFQIKDQKELDLRVGDSVHFSFVWSDTSPY